jgi:hypothetical protein
VASLIQAGQTPAIKYFTWVVEAGQDKPYSFPDDKFFLGQLILLIDP